MKFKSITAAALLIILPSLCHSSGKKEIYLGFGAGYSLALTGALRYEYDFPNEIYFKEKGNMKHCLNINVQYFFSRRLGLQLELGHQKASYFSHLEWYGVWVPDGIPDPPPLDPADDIYTEINHIEDPYWETCSLSSLTVSLIWAGRRYLDKKIYPYAFAGVGLYILNGDKDRVLDRWRLGIKKWNEKIKIGGGLKYRLSSELGLNLRIFGETIRRRSLGERYTLYVGPEQFDYLYYKYENKIGRTGKVLVNTFTYVGIDLSLEFRL